MTVDAASQPVVARATGSAVYGADRIPANALVVGLVRSVHAHARITSVDLSRALALPGVVDVLTAVDFGTFRLGHLKADEPVLTDIARYAGEPIAAVAAETPEALDTALTAVEVVYEVLPLNTSMDAAQSGIALHDYATDNVADRFSAHHGDWDRVVDDVAFWAKGVFETDAIAHAYLEPRTCAVEIDENTLVLISGNHFPSIIADEYSDFMQRPVRVVNPEIGGSFGAKWEHPNHLVCLTFAARNNRPTTLVMSRTEDMVGGRTRLPMRLWMRIGATANGRIVAKESKILADNGAYSCHGPSVLKAAATRIDNLYRYRALRSTGELIYTNNIPTECFRGFGSPQSSFAQEQLVDDLASQLGIDPVEIRRRSATQPGDTTLQGWKINNIGLTEELETVAGRVSEFDLPDDDDRFRYGIGVACGTHGISNAGYSHRPDIAMVRLVMSGGTIEIRSNEVEIGAGTGETLISIVSARLGVDRSFLRVRLGDSELAPFGLGSFASRTSFFAINAAIDACHQLAADVEGTIGDALSTGVAVDVIGSYQSSGVEAPDEQFKGNTSPGYTFGTHACAVRVDTWTGKIEVLQYWAAHDPGTILNKLGADGQVVGGVMQGLGHALTERNIVDEEGRLLNPGYLDYRIPTFADAVPIEIIYTGDEEPEGPDGAKTIAEPPIIPVAACVANAIFDATGVRQTRFPMTPERVFWSLES